MSKAEDAPNAVAELLGEGWLIPVAERALEPQVVQLAHAVKHGARELDSITLGNLKGVHVRRAPETWETHEPLLLMAGLLSGLPDGVLDQLEGQDLHAVVGATMRALWPILELPAVAADLPAPKTRPWPIVDAGLELVLTKRISAGGDARSSLTFRSITGKMVRRLPTTLSTRHLPGLVQDLAQIGPELFDQLEGVDLQRALGVAQCFFAGSRRTTAPSGS